MLGSQRLDLNVQIDNKEVWVSEFKEYEEIRNKVNKQIKDGGFFIRNNGVAINFLL